MATAPADLRNCPRHQTAKPNQAAKKTATVAIISKCQASVPGATLMAESPRSPSKLAAEHTNEVVSSAFMFYQSAPRC